MFSNGAFIFSLQFIQLVSFNGSPSQEVERVKFVQHLLAYHFGWAGRFFFQDECTFSLTEKLQMRPLREWTRPKISRQDGFRIRVFLFR